MPRSAGRKSRESAPIDAGDSPEEPDGSVPIHVAIIMDGNGRWAQECGKSRLDGHRAGADSVREIVRTSPEFGVKVLSLYAFSSENWSRPRAEITGLFKLLLRFIKSETPELVAKGVRLKTIGRLDALTRNVQDALARAEEATAGGEQLTVCLALNYGAHDELVDAARLLALEAKNGMIKPEAIDRADMERCLYTAGLPPVDLLIRTGGDLRVSNFLLWQLSYAELYFTRTCWPGFRREQYRLALEDFAIRQRRFGGL